VAPTLEFFIQVDDMELRARFLKVGERPRGGHRERESLSDRGAGKQAGN
jgi:hypothetical protein